MACCIVQLGGQLGSPVGQRVAGLVLGRHLSQLGPLAVHSGGHLAYSGVQLALSPFLCLS